MVDYARMHMHFRDILPVDPDKHLYRIPFTRGGDMLEERFHLLVENKVPFLTPMPRVGQIDSNAVRVMHTTNLTMRMSISGTLPISISICATTTVPSISSG